MTVEENWINVLDKMQVSKLVKNYIVSIDEETRDFFTKTIEKIEQSLKEEIYTNPYVSSFSPIVTIVNKEMQVFVDNVVSLIDYYADGIYNCGKTFSRKKLKLEKQKPEQGKKYYFNKNDLFFIGTYRAKKINEINSFLDSTILKHINDFVNLKLNGEWNMDDDSDYEKMRYKKQELKDEDFIEINDVVKKSLETIYDEVLEFIVREIITLYQRSQVQEYLSLGINTFTIFADDDEKCCSICSTKSGKIFNISELLDQSGDLRDGYQHALCKYSIEPVINYRDQITSIYFDSAFSIRPDSLGYGDNSLVKSEVVKKRIDFELEGISFKNLPIEMEKRVQSLISKLKIHYKNIMKNQVFIFEDDISNNADWLKSIKDFYIEKGNSDFQANNLSLKDQDVFTNQIATFNDGKNIYISALSFDSQPVEYLVLREMLRNQLVIDDEIKHIYSIKQKSKKVAYGVSAYKDPFISFLSEQSEKEYLLEIVIHYILQENKLKYVDEKGFNYVEKKLLNILSG